MTKAAIVHPRVSERIFSMAIRPLLSEPETYAKAGLTLVAFAYPYLDLELDWHRHGSSIRLRVDGMDFSYRPVGGWWIDPSGQPLNQGANLVPSNNGFHILRESGEQRCWFCFPGWREYHDHSSHQDVSWASLRRDRGYSVLQLVAQLHQDLNAPGVMKS